MGPLSPLSAPVLDELRLRRYLCRRCNQTCTVGPDGLIALHHYTSCAIAFALALWSTGLAQPTVRERVSPFVVVGVAAALRWASLKRWAGREPAGVTYRERATGRIDALLATSVLPPSAGGLPARAFYAAEHGGWCPSAPVHAPSRSPP